MSDPKHVPPPIDDWSTALREPGFWAAYLGSGLELLAGERRGPVLERLFGPAGGFDADRLYGPDPEAGLVDDDLEPRRSVLTIQFPRDYRWSIEFSWEGIFHTLHHESLSRPLLLGYDDPHFHLPILRWNEVVQLAGHADTVSADHLMALLAPVAWATSDREARVARDHLAAALDGAGIATPGNASEAAGRLVLRVASLVWRPDPALGWVNDGSYSHRNPANGRWTPVEFARFRRFVEGPPRAAPTTPAGREPVWQARPGGPVGPGLAVDGDTLVCTTWPSTLHAVDARTGRNRWSVPVPEPGYSRAAPAIAGGHVYYVGGRHDLDLVRFPRNGVGEPSATLSLEPRQFRGSLGHSVAYAGATDVTPVIHENMVLVAGTRLHVCRVGPPDPQVRWHAAQAGWLGSTAPVVAGGRVFLAGRDYRGETIASAVDLDSGTRLWERSTGVGPVNRPVADGGELFVPAGSLLVLDPRDGTELWSVPTEREWRGVIAVTPTRVVGTTCRLADALADDDRPEWIYTVVCVDRRSHAIAWTFTDRTRQASAGVVAADGVAYSVGHDDTAGTLNAIDITTGRLTWRADLGRCGALPVTGNGMVYVSTMTGVLQAFPAT